MLPSSPFAVLGIKHPHADVVDLRQIINAASAAHVVAPRATYKLVRSGGGSSLFGNAVLGFVAASARPTNSSLMLLQVTLTCSGVAMLMLDV